MSRILLLYSVLLLPTFALFALGPDVPIATDKAKLALDGYDMVAYFETEKGQKGIPLYSSTYRNATWYFSSAENQSKFEANPEKYMPEFGGYCAYAISKKKATKGKGKYGRLVDGKLYFSADFLTQLRYNLNTKYYNNEAKQHWQELQPSIEEKN